MVYSGKDNKKHRYIAFQLNLQNSFNATVKYLLTFGQFPFPVGTQDCKWLTDEARRHIRYILSSSYVYHHHRRPPDKVTMMTSWGSPVTST